MTPEGGPRPTVWTFQTRASAAWWRLTFGLPLAALGGVAVHTALTALRANASVEGGRTAVLLALAALGLHLTVRGARDAFAAPRVHRGVVEAFEVQSLPDQRGMSRAEVTLITGGRRWYVPGQAIDLDRGEPIEVTFTAGSKTLLTIRALGRDRPDPTA